MCLFCSKTTKDQLIWNLVVNHSREMCATACAISCVVTRNMTRGYKLVTLSHIRGTVGHVLWDNVKTHARVYR